MIYERQTFVDKTADQEGTLICAEHFNHIEDALEKACSPLVNYGIQNLCLPSEFKSGYNQYNTASTGWGTVSGNPSYNVIFLETKLTSKEIITFWTASGQPVTARFVSAFDENKNKRVDLSVENAQMYTVPEGISYLAVTFKSADGTNICIQKANKSTWLGYVEPLKEIVTKRIYQK